MASQATQQCFMAGGPTVYGAVTVTVAGCNSYNAPFAPFVAGESLFINSGVTCTYSFSKPLVTSSLSIQVNSVTSNVELTIATNAGPYISAIGDIGVPLTGSVDTSPLSISGSGYKGAFPTQASGTLSLTNGAPSTFASIAISQSGPGDGSLLKICADDADAPSPTPVPTFSEWAMITFAMLIAGFGIYQQRRRQS